MHLIRHLPKRADAATAIAIGNFDGLHLGHGAVIEAMQRAAQKNALIPTVLTFEPHPRRFFAPATPAFRLMRLSDKLRALEARDVERVAMPRFDTRFASIAAEEFLEHVLDQQLGAKAVITGENFVFGHERRGDLAMLSAWGAAQNIAIVTVPPVRVDGEICSSSAIRAALRGGDVARATALLGRPFMLRGRVVHGQAKGRTFGYPTANIAMPSPLQLPAHGVYAIRARWRESTYTGVMNIGVRPTVADNARVTIEVHLFDFMQEIYGKTLEISLINYIRSEMKFDSLEALKTQIAKDCDTAIRLLEKPSS